MKNEELCIQNDAYCRLVERSFHTPLLMPPTLIRPLVDTGADLIFDQAVTIRLQQLVLPEHSASSHTSSSVTRDVLAHYLVAHSLGCERAHLALGHRHMYVFDAVCLVYTCRRLIDLSALYTHAGD